MHEAYIRLVNVEETQQWNSLGHFFAAAAEAMRRILVENARRKVSLKRGADYRRIDLDAVEAVLVDPDEWERAGHDGGQHDRALVRHVDDDPDGALVARVPLLGVA